MNKLVYTVFSTLAFAIIFVFVWDMVFYLYRVNSLNTRIENITSAMQNVVMQNNYMPEYEAKVFQQLLKSMADDYNRTVTSDVDAYAHGSTHSVNDFILYMDWNYNDDAVIPSSGITSLVDSASRVYEQMGVAEYSNNVPDYGDIVVIQLRVVVAQPTWNFMQSSKQGLSIVAGNTGSANKIENNHVTTVGEMFTTELDYTYYVPCLRYKATWK